MRLSADNLFTGGLVAALVVVLLALPGRPAVGSVPVTELRVEGLTAGGASGSRTFTFSGTFASGRGEPGRFPGSAFLVLNRGSLEAAGREFALEPVYDASRSVWTFRSTNTLRPGQNSFYVEARDGARVLERSRDFTLSGTFSAAAFRVQMVWDRPLADVDLHALSPDGTHAFFGRKKPLGDGRFSLDYDFTGSTPGENGFGPENVTVTPAAPAGEYAFSVQYFQTHDEPGPVKSTVYLFNDRDERVATFEHTFGADETAPGGAIRGSGQSPWVGETARGVWRVPFDPAMVTKR